jgi:hypothetical protein
MFMSGRHMLDVHGLGRVSYIDEAGFVDISR